MHFTHTLQPVCARFNNPFSPSFDSGLDRRSGYNRNMKFCSFLSCFLSFLSPIFFLLPISCWFCTKWLNWFNPVEWFRLKRRKPSRETKSRVPTRPRSSWWIIVCRVFYFILFYFPVYLFLCLLPAPLASVRLYVFFTRDHIVGKSVVVKKRPVIKDEEDSG